MTATYQDALTAALRTAGVLAAGETASAEDGALVLERLNDMLAGLNIQGALIVTMTGVGTTNLPVADELIEGVKFMLAEAIADDFGASLSPTAMRKAAEGRRRIQAATKGDWTAPVDRALWRRQSYDVTRG